MSVWRVLGWVGLALASMAPQFPLIPGAAPTPLRVANQTGDLSVLTYNIKAQPWPLAMGRASAAVAIADRLAAMRAAGRQPHVVMLQEAFTDQARRIARQAGYRYVARGPTHVSHGPRAPLGGAFARARRWDRGERSAAVFDSGLLILSDYPILRTSRFGFPAGACAGFDCLASKGVLIAWVGVPGRDQPVAFVDTHLNSRHSTQVAPGRADAAQAWQVAQLRKVIAQAIDPRMPAIFAGDTNVGLVPVRMAAFAKYPPLGDGSRDTLAEALATLHVDRGSLAEADAIMTRHKDMILARDGQTLRFDTLGATVPFAVDGRRALSDHAGFMVTLRLVDHTNT